MGIFKNHIGTKNVLNNEFVVSGGNVGRNKAVQNHIENNTKQSFIQVNGICLSPITLGEKVTQELLTEYALQEIGKLLNLTKIKNETDNHIWIYNEISKKWIDFGENDNFSIATYNQLGLVKGSNDTYKIGIDINGEMSVNGLVTVIEDLQQALFSALERIERLEHR